MNGSGEMRDVRDVPAYSYSRAAAILRMPASTIRAWMRGQKDFAQVFADSSPTGLSFNDLVEAYVLRLLRTKHRTKLSTIRDALVVAEKEYQITRLLVHRDLRFGAGELFLETISALVHLSKNQQLSMREVLNPFLDRVEYDASGLPTNIFPPSQYDLTTPGDARVIAISPYVSFGRPRIARRSISTIAVHSRFIAGETIAHISEDYLLQVSEVEEAIRFEHAA